MVGGRVMRDGRVDARAPRTQDLAAAALPDGAGGDRPAARVVAQRSRSVGGLPARDRRHTSGRARAVSARFTDEEYDLLAAAAAAAGLTPTGYMAEAALAAAGDTRAPAQSPASEALAELVQARGQLRRYGSEVHEAMTSLDPGHAPLWLRRAVERTQQAVERVDRAAALLARRAVR